MMSAEERYQSDPTFKMLVDMCYAAIEAKQYTPSELRDAAMLAAPLDQWKAIYWPVRWMTREELEKEFPSSSPQAGRE